MDALDAHRAAKVLLDTRGDIGARAHAAARLDWMRITGDRDGAAAWEAIGRALDALALPCPRLGQSVN